MFQSICQKSQNKVQNQLVYLNIYSIVKQRGLMSKLLDQMKKKLLQQSKKEKVEPIALSEEVKESLTLANPNSSDASKDQQHQLATQPASEILLTQITPIVNKQPNIHEFQAVASPAIKCPPSNQNQEKAQNPIEPTIIRGIDESVKRQDCDLEIGEIAQKSIPFHESLQIFKQVHPFSVSVDQEYRNSVLNNIQEKPLDPRSEQSKQQKKCKKIILKELTKVKQCIKNLQGAVKGLQYLQSRMKYNPSMRVTIKKYLNELKFEGNF